MIPLVRPSIKRADMDAVLRRLANDAIGEGDLSRELARATARYLGRRNAIALRSPAQAVRMTVGALGLEAGSRVGVSPFLDRGVIATLRETGCVPVVVDTLADVPVLPSPLDIDYGSLRLDALVADTCLGFVPDLESMSQLGIPLIEVVSDGLGAHTGHRSVGSFGEIAIVGMEADNIVTAAGGAVCVTNNTRLLAAMNASVDDNPADGTLPDMNAALALTQLARIEELLEKRASVASTFHKTALNARRKLPVQPGDAEPVYAGFPVFVDGSPAEVEAYARKHGVVVGRLSLAPVGDEMEPVHARRLAGRLVVFPLYPTMSAADQRTIQQVLSTMLA